jgi:hypothetical protein
MPAEVLADRFVRSRFGRFINSSAGRGTRVVAGLVLAGWASTMTMSVGKIVVLVPGMTLLVAGMFDLCLVCALLGGRLSGRAAVAAARQEDPGAG